MTSSALYFTEHGSGSPLLLIHGLMVSGEMFEPVVAPFARHHRLIIPDLRGHGRSRQLPPPYTVAELARDLSQLLDHLGIVSTAVLGYSQGGAVAQQLALDVPERCSRLVLACTYAFNLATLRERLEGSVAPLLLKTLGMKRFARLVFSLGLKEAAKARAEPVIAVIGGQDLGLMLEAWKAAMAFDSRSRLREIKCPTLIVAAENDVAVPSHHAKMLNDGITGSKLSVVEGTDHALIWEKPDAFVQVVEEFLSS